MSVEIPTGKNWEQCWVEQDCEVIIYTLGSQKWMSVCVFRFCSIHKVNRQNFFPPWKVQYFLLACSLISVVWMNLWGQNEDSLPCNLKPLNGYSENEQPSPEGFAHLYVLCPSKLIFFSIFEAQSYKHMGTWVFFTWGIWSINNYSGI